MDQYNRIGTISMNVNSRTIRNNLVEVVSKITTVNLQAILYGNENLSFKTNERIYT